MRAMRARVRSGLGLALVALGVAGVVMPLVPGVPLMVAGMALLGSDHPISRAIVQRLRRWRARGTEAS